MGWVSTYKGFRICVITKYIYIYIYIVGSLNNIFFKKIYE